MNVKLLIKAVLAVLLINIFGPQTIVVAQKSNTEVEDRKAKKKKKKRKKKGEEEVVEEPKEVAPPPVDPNLSPCPKFTDAPNKDEAETNYVLYRDFLKVKEWDQAFDYWQKVYAVAPAADGKRNTVYADGIRFHQHFYAATQDEAEKEKHVDRIFELYDEIGSCYQEQEYVAARKSFDLYYKYPKRATREEIYQMAKGAIDADIDKVPDFIVNPFTSLLVEMYLQEKIDVAEAQKYDARIKEIVANGVEKCEGVGCQRWEIIQGYAPVRLEAFETVQGFYDCNYYLDKFYPDFEEDTTNCDVIRMVYSRLKWGGCEETMEKFKHLVKVGNEECVEETALQKAYQALRDAEYELAIELFEAAADEEEDIVKKSKYLLLVAKVYYSHLKRFGKAREYALKAAGARDNWGEPYLLIGQLYASSGPLCGPGTGWDSQIVTWPAIDKWNYAKRIDPSVAAEANKWIGRYAKYMPSRGDIFQRGLQEGGSFSVGCWIQEKTRIRAAKK